MDWDENKVLPLSCVIQTKTQTSFKPQQWKDISHVGQYQWCCFCTNYTFSLAQSSLLRDTIYRDQSQNEPNVLTLYDPEKKPQTLEPTPKFPNRRQSFKEPLLLGCSAAPWRVRCPSVPCMPLKPASLQERSWWSVWRHCLFLPTFPHACFCHPLANSAASESQLVYSTLPSPCGHPYWVMSSDLPILEFPIPCLPMGHWGTDHFQTALGCRAWPSHCMQLARLVPWGSTSAVLRSTWPAVGHHHLTYDSHELLETFSPGLDGIFVLVKSWDQSLVSPLLNQNSVMLWFLFREEKEFFLLLCD